MKLKKSLRFMRVTNEKRRHGGVESVKIFKNFMLAVKEYRMAVMYVWHGCKMELCRYVWHGCKWNFAGPQIYLQPAKIKIQDFGVLLKFLVCN